MAEQHARERLRARARGTCARRGSRSPTSSPTPSSSAPRARRRCSAPTPAAAPRSSRRRRRCPAVPRPRRCGRSGRRAGSRRRPRARRRPPRPSPRSRAPRRRQVGRHAPLLGVLPATDEHQVGVLGQRVAEAHARHLAADAVRRAARAQRDQVAAVGVDVHHLGVQDEHADRAAVTRSSSTRLRSARLPVGPAPERARQHLAHLEHRGVGRDHVEPSRPPACDASAVIEGPRVSRLDPLRVMPAEAQPQRQVVARACRRRPASAARPASALDVRVVDPRDVAAVLRRRRSAAQSRCSGCHARRPACARASLRPVGFLASSTRTSRPRTAKRSWRPNAGPAPVERGDRRLAAAVRGRARRRRRPARCRSSRARPAAARAPARRAASSARSATPSASRCTLRATPTSGLGRASRAATRSASGRCGRCSVTSYVERAAAAAEARVRGVLGGGSATRASSTPKKTTSPRAHLGQLRHRRVVGVEHERQRHRRRVSSALPPAAARLSRPRRSGRAGRGRG